MRVGIVGLGIAGLRTAMLLEARGVEVTCFEAQDHVGGRLKTIQTETGFYEAGGEWIDADHYRLIELVRSFQGEPVPPPRNSTGRLRFGGESISEDALWPDAAADWTRFEEAVDIALLDLDLPPWSNVLYEHWDRRTLAQFIAEKTLSKHGQDHISAYIRSDEGEEVTQIGLLGWLCGAIHYAERKGDEMSSFRFPNGAQQLCKSMAAAIEGRIHLSTPIRKVELIADQVILKTDGEEFTFDHVVFAIPPQCFLNIEFDPFLSEGKWEANEACILGRTIKIALRFRSKFWLDHGWDGRALSETAFQQVWDGSRGDDPVLLCYICGDQAENLAMNANAVQIVLDSIEEFCPGAAKEFVEGTVHDWMSDPWAGGGFSHIPPEFVLTHWENLIRPEGRLHFAGEHAAERNGFIEGALESAERVVEEINGG